MFTISSGRRSSSRRSSSSLPIASNCPSLSPKLFYQSLLLASCFILEVTVTVTSCLAPDSLIASTCCSLHAPVFRVFSMCACILNSLSHVFVVLFLCVLADRRLCSFCLFRLHIFVGLLVFSFVLAMFRYYVDFVYFVWVYLSATTKAHF